MRFFYGGRQLLTNLSFDSKNKERQTTFEDFVEVLDRKTSRIVRINHLHAQEPRQKCVISILVKALFDIQAMFRSFMFCSEIEMTNFNNILTELCMQYHSQMQLP